MRRQLQTVPARLPVEVRQQLLVLRGAGELHFLDDALALHAHELELEPLPATDVVVTDDKTGEHEQTEARQGEYPIQPANRVIVRNRLLWLHRFYGALRR